MRARAYKIRATSRHEYVSLTVVDPNNKNTSTYVAIERHRGDLVPADIDPNIDSNINPNIEPNINSQPLFSSSNSSISSISSASDSISPSRLADDRISPLPSTGMKDKNDELICELNFTREVYLYELAVLALVVHEVNKSYLLVSNNYYHFAGTLMKMLEEKYDTVDTTQGAGAGKWCGVLIYKKGNISSLLENFEAAINKFVSFVFVLSN